MRLEDYPISDIERLYEQLQIQDHELFLLEKEVKKLRRALRLERKSKRKIVRDKKYAELQLRSMRGSYREKERYEV